MEVIATPARRLWPFAPTHLYLGAPLLYDMLLLLLLLLLLLQCCCCRRCSCCCFEATGAGWRAAAAAQGVHEMQVWNRMSVCMTASLEATVLF